MKREKTYIINNSTLKVIFGDILSSNAEVIVSSDDAYISMGGGVSGAIKSKGGESIYQDGQKHTNAQQGDVIVTTAGTLKQKYIFHAITISKEKRTGQTYGIADKTNDLYHYVIRQTVDKCCKLVSLLNLSSIAFPAIGGGVASIPYEIIAQEMAKSLSNNLCKTNKCISVELYLFDRFNYMSDLDFITFFEQIAISIQESKNSQDRVIEHHNDLDVMSTTEIQIEDFDPEKNKDHQVFVSYSRKNKDIVLPICQQLLKSGIRVWIDLLGKYHSKDYKEAIVEAIESSLLVVFVSSKESNESPNVRKEIAIASKEQKRILPIIIDETQYAKSINYDLCDIEWIDYRQHDTQTLEQIVNDIIYSLNI